MEHLKLTPPKIKLANLPTRIDPYRDKLPDYPLKPGVRLWFKRDDQTGTELSGNKVRKLEYSLAEALRRGCDTVITSGGVQSNHCRATAAAAAMLGLDCHLVLRSDEEPLPEGNLLLDRLLGATPHYIAPDKYRAGLAQIMQDLADQLQQQGKKPYLIPTGASNGIGTFGYFDALDEILEQEKALGAEFDTIVCAVGSGGTYAGLALANKAANAGKNIVGFAVCDDTNYFVKKALELSDEFSGYSAKTPPLDERDIRIIDTTVGLGYAQSTPEERQFIRDVARSQGIVFDPVYTGKALRGLLHELSKGNHPYFEGARNVLFIHTGGLYGLMHHGNSETYARELK